MKLFRFILRICILGVLGAVWLLAGVFLYLSPALPDVATLRDVRLQTPMRVYTAQGDLIGQFGEQKRNPLTYDQIPQQFVEALLAAEDDSFFEHRGIDFKGLLRAASELVLTGEKVSGGSTLTMQVARNYFLTLERTFLRKFREILLAIQIERFLDKQEIFELYFNRVFLGHRAYGFEAAAQVYYGKSIGELNLAQHAMLAGIPKAPSRNNPLSGPEAGRLRRDWILGRMLNLGYIDRPRYEAAVSEPVTARPHGARIAFAADYAAEMARQEMLDRYGLAAYSDGYQVYTTIDSELQQVAQRALENGLITYDSRHGYRGPERRLGASGGAAPGGAPPREWLEALAETPVLAGLTPAVVSEVREDSFTLLLPEGASGQLLWESGPSEARPYLSENRTDAPPQSPSELFAAGDLIRVYQDEEGDWRLGQVPAVQGALVSLDPDNGAIISIVGGLGFAQSKFNRATQAQRQPGSNFKPFVYAAALNAGFTAASIINDAPIVMEDTSLEGAWRPENDGGKFYGPTRLRWALTKSRNLVSIRLLQQLGVERLVSYLDELGFDTGDMTRDLTLALGTHVVSPLEMAAAYAILANGGYRIEPYLISRITDLEGETVWEARPPTVCDSCGDGDLLMPPAGDRELSMEEILAQAPEEKLPRAPRVMDARINFIIDSILQDVIRRGTGTRARVLERSDIAGKTGTTNGPMDAWFSGYNRDVVTTTWVGFDAYTPLGRREFGGTAALPIWIDFMREALRDSPVRDRGIPPGVVSVRIDPDTGLLAAPGQPGSLFEYFRQEHVPEPAPVDSGIANSRDDLIRDLFD